ncbi:CDP-glucose 4,6-dehydratase [Clostridium sp. UBA4548]|uniref:CDP-glucose 4,6-dehydratase n=1 Tax=Clostridium sp. UBA4548 TaxID=1946361 RepID=UPI0025BF7D35|nr:CDP-glucose 4,6-dehydratase [Clostridium sp. UBA4548]
MKESFWKGKRVLITGSTGFKGCWLSLWLNKLGADVIGYSLQPPSNPNMFETIKLKQKITYIYGNILDMDKLMNNFEKYEPEVVFHLAAQPLVRKSYDEPFETFNTNVMGTVNVFNAVRNSKSVKVVVNVTSDKCYENKEWNWGYRENESMGGHDPYSCSKGCAELITNSFRKSYFTEQNIYLASARAGNVIGGGDWAEDRLIPDIVRCLVNNQNPVIRNPYSIRPWQHVLEPLGAYMLIAEKMWEHGHKYAEGWNFGPENESTVTVAEVANQLMTLWGMDEGIILNIDTQKKLHEAQFLKLDCSKARYKLGWSPKLTIKETLDWTMKWYKAFEDEVDMYRFSLSQIENYEKLRSNENGV